MKRFAILIYGVVCYLVFFATFLYAIGFIGNLIVPKSIDSVPTVSIGTALFIDTCLLAVFAVQHSLMARPFFKRAWKRIVPEAAERSTYVLFSSLALILLFALWQPMGGVIWDIDNSLARNVLHASYAFGWLLVLASTFAIDHFDLFGLRQTWRFARGVEYQPPAFKQPILYRIVRHPLYVGWFFVFWSTPTMTVAHLFFAVATTVYTLIAIQLEERDLQDAHPEYRDYKRRVPMLIPAIGKLLRRSPLQVG
ncbi:MAG: isoprenylcysteine carboxylmethyltransferase family protein [Gammaproteobacteria bacterium]|nr:isoprenylcysteine carboxylmethyltransferase family protein [Gammaproteobacteria bacterium]